MIKKNLGQSYEICSYFPCDLDPKLPLTQMLQLTCNTKLCLLFHVGIENQKSIEILKSSKYVLHLMHNTQQKKY